MRSALLWPLAGLLGWAAAFVLVYALHGLGCASGWQHLPLGPVSLQRAVQAGSAAASVAGLALFAAWLHWRCAPALAARGEPLLARLTRASAWSGLAATGWTLFPVFATSTCR